MKTLLHIGAPKTATTYLQEAYYPCHPELAYIPHVTEWNRWLFCLSKSEPRALVTCEEGIMGQPQRRNSILKNLSELIKDPIVLITTRAPTPGLLASIYSQAIRGGDQRSFNSFFEHQLDVWKEIYNYDDLYRESCSIFGSERVSLLPYELLRDSQDRFLRELEAIVGISSFDPVKETPVNQKLTESQIIFYRTFASIVSRIASFRGNSELPLYAKKVYLSHSRKMGFLADKVGSLLRFAMREEPADTDRFLPEFSCYSPIMEAIPCYKDYLNIYKKQ